MLPSPLLDPSALLRFVLTALLLLAGALLLVRRAASRYFFVGDYASPFAADAEDSHRAAMSIGGAAREDAGACASCGAPGSKKCSRCKSVRYCSQACQTKHWGAEHKLKCKQAGSSNDVSTQNGMHRRRKASGFSSVSLVPARGTCKVLQPPKKILFPYDEFVKLFNWDKPGFPPCGLLNCGNSCFANVVLQCLACTRPLTAYLLERDHIKGCVRKHDDWCFLCELQVHIQRASESLHPFSPINILSRLPNIGGNLGYGRQEDAHEFMRFAIDTMQSICLDEFGGEKALDPSSKETTLIQHIFGGHLQSQVICTKCDKVSNRYDNMMDLAVEIEGNAESLQECLDQFTIKEWLDGENMYKCDGCNDYVKAWKQLTVHQAPNILTIALKRFQSGRFGKLNKRIAFPENLDLTPYMSGNRDGTDLYTLYAVVVHVDMLNASFFGHYICYTKDYSGRWYRIDDCKVVSVDVEEVLAQGAYMLLYSRKFVRPGPFTKPLEDSRKKQLAEVDPLSSNSSKRTNDVDALACPPTDTGLQSNGSLFESSANELPVRIDTKSKELEVVDVDVEIRDDTMLIDKDKPTDIGPQSIGSLCKRAHGALLMEVTGCKDQLPVENDTKIKELEVADMDAEIRDGTLMMDQDKPGVHLDDCNPGSSAQEDHKDTIDASPVISSQSSFISPVKGSFSRVEALDSEEILCLNCCREESNSLNAKNNYSEVAETSTPPSTASVPIEQSSDNVQPKLEQTEVSLNPKTSGDAVPKAKSSFPCMLNGSSRKLNQAFNCGFLDRPERRVSVHKGRTEADILRAPTITEANGCSNGCSLIDRPPQGVLDHNVSLSWDSSNGEDTISKSDFSFMSRGFLNDKSLDKEKIVTDLDDSGKAGCYMSAEPASLCQNGNGDNSLELTSSKTEGWSQQSVHDYNVNLKALARNGNHSFTRSDLSYMSRGFLNVPHKKPLNKGKTSGKDIDRTGHTRNAVCNGSTERAPCENGNVEHVVETPHVNVSATHLQVQ